MKALGLITIIKTGLRGEDISKETLYKQKPH